MSKKGLHIGLWVVQALLALAFVGAGATKLMNGPEALVAMGMNWPNRMPSFMRFVIGGSEVAGALGLILPSALRIMPQLTAAAAAGLALVMVLAGADHAMAGEMGNLPPVVVLGSLAGFVAWGRAIGAPIAAR